MPRELSSSGDEGQLESEEPDRSSEDEAPPRRRRRISSSSSSGAEAGGEDDARASEVRTNEDAAGGGAAGSDALGFSVPQSSELWGAVCFGCRARGWCGHRGAWRLAAGRGRCRS